MDNQLAAKAFTSQMRKRDNTDYYILILITAVVVYFSYLLRTAYPYEIIDWDTYSWYLHAKKFKLFSHSPFEGCRRLPFGLLLVIAKDYLDSNFSIFFLHVALLIASIYSFYLLTENFIYIKHLRIVSTFLLLFLTLMIQKLFYFNNVLLPEASCAYLFFIGANLTLIAYFRKNINLLILGYSILGVGAFYKGNTCFLIPIWLAFLFLIKMRFKFSVAISCFLLLILPSLLNEIKIRGYEGFQPSEYLLARVLPLIQENDRISNDLNLNNEIFKAYQSYILHNEIYKISPYDALLSINNYAPSGGQSWKKLIIEASGLSNINTKIAYPDAAFIIARRLMRIHLIDYMRLVFSRYFETLNPFHGCERLIAEAPEDRYKFFNSAINDTQEFKNVFFSENQKFEVAHDTMSVAIFLKSSCRNLSNFSSRVYAICIHIFLLTAIYIVIKFKRYSNSAFHITNTMLVYICFVLTVLPQLLITSAVHTVHNRHTVPFELLLNASIIIFLFSFLGFFYKRTNIIKD